MMLYDKISEMAKGSEDGWGKLYYHVLPRIIQENKFQTGAEIGVAYGGHSEAMLDNSDLKKLYSIDPYVPDYRSTDGYSIDGKKFTEVEYEELYLHALHRMRRFKERSEFLRYSSHAGFSLVPTPLDFVFIDAQHTFEDLYADITLWGMKIRKGGIISGHDFQHESYPGVTQAVRAHFGEPNTEDGFVWWVRL